MKFADYLTFTRPEWAELRSHTPLMLTEADLATMRGINERVSLEDVTDIYLPLSRLLNMYVAAARNLSTLKDSFLGRLAGRRPYVVAIAGSVAVGKSTFARVLQALLARWPDHPHVELVTTDGFLYPNAQLAAAGHMKRKGFPESYDMRLMVQFLADIKAGLPEVRAPVYSHLAYDIVPGQWQVVRQPDVLIFEGLNVLQPGVQGSTPGKLPTVIVSDLFDFSLYIDAEENDIEQWYIERFMLLQRTAFRNPQSYFHHYKDLPPDEAREKARSIWAEINLVNLRENIQPTRERAHLVVRKMADHSVGEVWLRQL
jgi:type I pantothenate kinase